MTTSLAIAPDEAGIDWPCRTISIDDLAALEQSEFFVGALLVRGIVVDGLAPEDFFYPSMRLLVEAGHELDKNGQTINATSLVGKVREWGLIENLRHSGGLDYVVALVEHRPLYCTRRHHVGVICAASRRRRISTAALKLHLAARDDGDVDEALREIARLAS